MKPNDENGKLRTAQRPFRVLLIAGSSRRQYNCPGVDSKARTLMLRMADRLPQEWEIDIEDLVDETGRPTCLRHREYYDPAHEPRDGRELYAPLVWQCRYSGIEVPDQLWRYMKFGMQIPYADNQAEHMDGVPHLYQQFDEWTTQFAAFVRQKGKVEPGKYRAYGYKAPSHRWADMKLKWRDLRMRFGHPPAGSSPAIHQQRGLNRDATLSPMKGEGEKARE